MAKWTNAVITNLGKVLENKVLSGGNITITRVTAGQGSVRLVELKEQTALVDEKQTLSITDTKSDNDVTTISVLLTVSDLEESYNLQQIGFYANDPDVGEILFAIAQAETETVLPTKYEMPMYSINFHFHFAMVNDSEMTVSVDKDSFVTIGLFDETISYVSKTISEEKDARVKSDDEIIENINSHKSDNDIHITSDERTKWDDADNKKHEHSNKSVLDASTASYTKEEKEKLKGIASGANAYVLPVAKSSELGGVKSGTDITVDSNGNVSVNDNSHKHIISNVDGLQSALDSKSSTGHTHDDRYYTEAEIDTKLNAKLNVSLKGTANGLAELDENGLVPSSQLPSYVDDVLEYSGKSSFPSTGETGKIYVDTSTNITYRWSGSTYVEISPSLALGETSSTAYRGDRGKIAYEHSQKTSGNPHGVTKSQVGLGNVPNVATNDQTPTYSVASANAELTSGEKLNVAMGKIAKAVSSLISHLANKSNPHGVTKSHVGLGNVDNTSDANKPISKATQAAIDDVYSDIEKVLDISGQHTALKHNNNSGPGTTHLFLIGNDVERPTYRVSEGSASSVDYPVAYKHELDALNSNLIPKNYTITPIGSHALYYKSICRKSGNIVFLNLIISSLIDTINSEISICTLQNDCIPPCDLIIPLCKNGEHFGYASINKSNGTVSFNTTRADYYLGFSITYVV